ARRHARPGVVFGSYLCGGRRHRAAHRPLHQRYRLEHGLLMDPRERFAGPEETLRAAFQGLRASMWTALPGYFVSFNTDDPGNITAVVQPGAKGVVRDPAGNAAAVDLPVLPDVPVVFPSGGGCTLTFPLQPGDECLAVFASRCIDGWWQSGGSQLPVEPRMHDLAD